MRDGSISEAVRFGLAAATAGTAFLVMAAVWVSTCAGDTADAVACGVAQRTLLALAAPVILLVAGVWAFVRTYQARKRNESWRAWLGAGWFLTTLMVVALMTSLAALNAYVVQI